MEQSFILNTSYKHFYGWLRIFSSRDTEEKFPTEKGYIHLLRAEVRPTFYETYKIMSISGAYVVQKDTDSYSSYPLPDLLEFHIQELNDKRIEVTIRKYSSAIDSYIQKIISEVNRLWPESKLIENEIGQIGEGIKNG